MAAFNYSQVTPTCSVGGESCGIALAVGRFQSPRAVICDDSRELEVDVAGH